MKHALVASVLPVVCLFAALPLIAADGAIPIWEPTTITEPGKYVVTRDISGGIGIEADDVELDLNGFTIADASTQIVAYDVQGLVLYNGYTQGEEHVFLTNVTDFVVRGLVFNGGEDGLRISGSSRGLVENNFANVEGILVEGSHITVRNNHVVGNIEVRESDSCRIIGNEVEGSIYVGQYGFGGGNGNAVIDNLVRGGRIAVLGGSNGVVERNVVTEGYGFVFGEDSSNYVYRGNIARGNGRDPAACPNPSGTADFCDKGTGNTSHGDNYMPDQR